MPATIMDVVHVVAVRHGHMAAALAVRVVVALVHRVIAGRLAFVVMTVVLSVKVAVVHVIDVVAVGNRDMPTPLAVAMVMADVLSMCSCHLASQSCVRQRQILVAAHAARYVRSGQKRRARAGIFVHRRAARIC